MKSSSGERPALAPITPNEASAGALLELHYGHRLPESCRDAASIFWRGELEEASKLTQPQRYDIVAAWSRGGLWHPPRWEEATDFTARLRLTSQSPVLCLIMGRINLAASLWSTAGPLREAVRLFLDAHVYLLGAITAQGVASDAELYASGLLGRESLSAGLLRPSAGRACNLSWRSLPNIHSDLILTPYRRSTATNRTLGSLSLLFDRVLPYKRTALMAAAMTKALVAATESPALLAFLGRALLLSATNGYPHARTYDLIAKMRIVRNFAKLSGAELRDFLTSPANGALVVYVLRECLVFWVSQSPRLRLLLGLRFDWSVFAAHVLEVMSVPWGSQDQTYYEAALLSCPVVARSIVESVPKLGRQLGGNPHAQLVLAARSIMYKHAVVVPFDGVVLRALGLSSRGAEVVKRLAILYTRGDTLKPRHFQALSARDYAVVQAAMRAYLDAESGLLTLCPLSSVVACYQYHAVVRRTKSSLLVPLPRHLYNVPFCTSCRVFAWATLGETKIQHTMGTARASLVFFTGQFVCANKVDRVCCCSPLVMLPLIGNTAVIRGVSWLLCPSCAVMTGYDPTLSSHGVPVCSNCYKTGAPGIVATLEWMAARRRVIERLT